MMKRILTVFMVLSLLLAGTAESGFSKVGTAAAQFLKIGIGARAMGMGETFVAVADDATALYWNPAGIANLSSRSLAINHTRWFADIGHDFVGFVLPWGQNGVLGISAISLNTSEQEVTTVEEPDGTGIYYDVNDIAVNLSFARALTDRFSTGLGVKYIQQNAYNESASTIAVDIGTHLRTGYRGLAIAMCISNFGGMMRLEGRDLIALVDIDGDIAGEYNPDARLKTEQWPLPLNFRFGLAMDVIGGPDSFLPVVDSRFTLAVDGNHPNDNNERINVGGEYAWRERVFIRGGYSHTVSSSNDGGDSAQRYSVGGGIRFPLGQQVMSIDYAMADMNELGKVGRFSAEFRF